MEAPELVDIIHVGNTLGEGIVWDDVNRVIRWTDIEERKLYSYRLETQSVESFDVPERLCALGLTSNNDRIICAFETGFAFVDMPTLKVSWIVRPLRDKPGIRFNDGRVDRQGRFWCGTTTEGPHPQPGALYRLNRSLALSEHVGNIHTANAICWSPDSTQFYFADSHERTIRSCEFDPDDGQPSVARPFATTEEGVYPDGADVDAHGCLWNAQWGGGKIVRYRADGAVDHVLTVPTSQPTCLCFGGPNLDLLFVTSARKELSAQELAQSPHAGDVFVYRLAVKGILASRFGRE